MRSGVSLLDCFKGAVRNGGWHRGRPQSDFDLGHEEARLQDDFNTPRGTPESKVA